MQNRKQDYPNKNTLNLVMQDISPNYYKNVMIFAVAALILAALFAKFGIFDRLASASRLSEEATALTEYYAELKVGNTAYAEVRAEYEKYFTDVTDIEYADAMDVLDLVETNLMRAASVQSIVLSDNTVAVVLTGIDFGQASTIIKALYTHDLVESAKVTSASSGKDETATSSFSITIVLSTEGGQE